MPARRTAPLDERLVGPELPARRQDGRPQLSPVTAGVDGEGRVVWGDQLLAILARPVEFAFASLPLLVPLAGERLAQARLGGKGEFVALIGHFVGTRYAYERFGLPAEYARVAAGLWGGLGLQGTTAAYLEGMQSMLPAAILAVSVRRFELTTAPLAENLAAIDIGTNSIKLLVARRDSLDGGHWSEILREKEMVRLGQETLASGSLSEEAMADGAPLIHEPPPPTYPRPRSATALSRGARAATTACAAIRPARRTTASSPRPAAARSRRPGSISSRPVQCGSAGMS